MSAPDIDTTSRAWIIIVQELEAAILALGRELENPALTADQTAFIRGQIKQCRLIIALPDKTEPAPQFEHSEGVPFAMPDISVSF